MLQFLVFKCAHRVIVGTDLGCCEEINLQCGWTALICATNSGHADSVRLLIDAGADKDAKTNVRTG